MNASSASGSFTMDSMPPTQGSVEGLPLWSASGTDQAPTTSPIHLHHAPARTVVVPPSPRHRRRVSFGPDHIILITPRQTQHLTETCDSIPTPQDEAQTPSDAMSANTWCGEGPRVVIPLGGPPTGRHPQWTACPLGAAHHDGDVRDASAVVPALTHAAVCPPMAAFERVDDTMSGPVLPRERDPVAASGGAAEQTVAAVDLVPSQSSSLPLLSTGHVDGTVEVGAQRIVGDRTAPIMCGSSSTLDGASTTMPDRIATLQRGCYGSSLPEAQEEPSFGSTLDDSSIGLLFQSPPPPAPAWLQDGRTASSGFSATAADDALEATQRHDDPSLCNRSCGDSPSASSSFLRLNHEDADVGEATQRIVPPLGAHVPRASSLASSSSNGGTGAVTPDRLSSFLAADDANTAPTGGGPVCVFCGQQDKAVLLHSGYYLHVHCALWCPEVYCDPMSEQFRHMSDALQRIKHIKCAYCRQPGASIGCLEGSCERSYHYHCAQAAHCHMYPSSDASPPPSSDRLRGDDGGQVNFVMLCPAHSGFTMATPTSKSTADPAATLRSGTTSGGRRKRARSD